MAEVDCDYCGETMNRRPSRIEKYDNLFCGNDCKNAHHSEKMTGRERPEHAELMSEMHSGEGNPAWDGGGQSGRWRSTSEWQETRASALERDGHECQDCGKSPESLHAHHIEPVAEGGDKFDVSNVTTLCPEHHYERH